MFCSKLGYKAQREVVTQKMELAAKSLEDFDATFDSI
jgi:hypothetical protein